MSKISGNVKHGYTGGGSHEVPVTLNSDEDILATGEISYGIFWKAAVVATLAILLLITVRNLGIFLLLVAAIMFVVAYLERYFLLLILTNQRVIIRHGVIKIDTTQIRLSRIESAEVEHTIPGMLLGYGAVVLSGTGSRISAVPFVANASHFRNKLDEILMSRESQQSDNSDN
jgi:uncharacterized membrane protein YdbT with pleckstrin-like domain